MFEVYDLIGGEGAAKAILAHPLGSVGLISYDGVVRSAYLRAHSDPDMPAAYMAAYDIYGSVEEMVADSGVAFDRGHGGVLVWWIGQDGASTLCRYDEQPYADDARSLVEDIEALPAGHGFLIGDCTSPLSEFVLGLRTPDGVLTSGCGPSIVSEHFSDDEDGNLSDIADDPRANALTVGVLDVYGQKGNY